jgi:hypothetical protein
MAIITQTIESSANIQVALVIESGKLKPVWFTHTGDRIFIKEIFSVCSYHQGSAKIINISVTAGGNGYRLSLNTEAFTWTLGVLEESEFPSATSFSGDSYRDRG